MSNRKTYPIEFEWDRPASFEKKTVSARCWNSHFWYGDGRSATEASVIMRRSDYNAMRRELRQLRALRDRL